MVRQKTIDYLRVHLERREWYCFEEKRIWERMHFSDSLLRNYWMTKMTLNGVSLGVTRTQRYIKTCKKEKDKGIK